jgi:hypothetical protein
LTKAGKFKIGGAFPLFWSAKQKINDIFPNGFEPTKAYLTIGGAFPYFGAQNRKYCNKI